MTGKLLFFCGKMAAGKSTLAASLPTRENAMLFVQDEWLDTLYPNGVINVATYLEYSGENKQDCWRLSSSTCCHVACRSCSTFRPTRGTSGRGFAASSSVPAPRTNCTFVDTSDAVCKAQLRARSAHLPPGTKWTSEEDFELISSHFRAPAEDEGFNVIVHRRS